MLQVSSKELYPELYNSVGVTAEEYYKKYDTAEKALEEEIVQGQEVEAGIVAMLESYFPWERLVIEGIALSPRFVSELQKKYPSVHFDPVILYDNNRQRIADRIDKRGLWGPRDSYPRHLVPREVEWVILYNDFFKSQAQKYGYRLLSVDELLGL
jgi:2-phosphoglycerate kinase